MSDCTIIIPTHNRHEYFKRVFKYYKNIDINLILCDSSDNYYNSHIPSGITYNHMPNSGFVGKMYKTLISVKTQYVLVCPDDDFILKSSILEGVNFLNTNKEYHTYIGRYVGFLQNFNKRYYKLYLDSKYKPHNLRNENIRNFMSNYYMVMWGLYRKEVIIRSYSILAKSKFENDNYIELTIGTVLSFLGNIKLSNIIWGVREIEFSKSWGKRNITLNREQANIDISEYNSIKKNCDEFLAEGVFEISFQSYCGFLEKNIAANNRFKYFIKQIIPSKLFSYTYKLYKPPIPLTEELKEISDLL
jgi:glycosyltransferase domain-containing protein